MYAGTSGEALIVAGGTDLAETPPTADRRQGWSDRVFVLTDPEGSWESAARLPRPLAHGISVSADGGLICLGGTDGERHYADALVIRYSNGAVTISELPDMPRANAFGCGAVLGDTIYVAGGREQPDSPAALAAFWALDLSVDGAERRWKELPPWPGAARMSAVAAVQDEAFFVVGGATLDPSREGGRKQEFLADGYRYDPAKERWTQIADLPRPAAAAPSPALALGQAHFAVIGGQPDFSADILVYHTITDTWIRAGRFPEADRSGVRAPVDAPTTWWRDAAVVAGGRIGPGEPTRNVAWARPKETTKGFRGLDYAMLILYFAALVIMGFYFARREKTTNDFFLAGHRVPWWAAGISIFGTQLSAITFMATPALVYHTNWVYIVGNVMVVAMIPVFVFFYIPFFKRLNVTTAYEYLEKRFNVTARLLGSLTFLLYQVGRMGVVLFLPALALAIVTGINVYVCIALMGLLATLYTVLGGIEAVIWTDVLQVIVLLGGAMLCLVLIVFGLAGGAGGFVGAASEAGKLHAFDFRFDLTAPTFWVVLLGGLAATFISYGSDQTVIQRYLTTRDERSAARGIWTNAVLTVPATLLFFALGAALYVFYSRQPHLLNPTLENADAIFPWYIVTRLPAGVAGLLIAGVFAAAMSSLDSSMNSVATALTTDFYGRFRPGAPDARRLRVARILTAVVGLAGTAFALVMADWDIKSLWDQLQRFIGLFAGGLGGLFLLGIFSRRAHGVGAVIGLVASGAVQYAVSQWTPLHLLLYTVTGIGSCVVIGYLASLVIPVRRKPLEGLTVYTLHRRGDE